LNYALVWVRFLSNEVNCLTFTYTKLTYTNAGSYSLLNLALMVHIYREK